MTPEEIISKYYAQQPALHHILLTHSRAVAERAVSICDRHPELHADRQFVYEAAMLHDIGILHTNAPGIECHGTEPYIIHGYLGGQMLRREGLERHARVAERHTGTGLTAEAIQSQGLPLPQQDWSPESIEEVIICYADKFYSKSNLERIKTPQQVARSLEMFGQQGVEIFLNWYRRFEATESEIL